MKTETDVLATASAELPALPKNVEAQFKDSIPQDSFPGYLDWSETPRIAIKLTGATVQKRNKPKPGEKEFFIVYRGVDLATGQNVEIGESAALRALRDSRPGDLADIACIGTRETPNGDAWDFKFRFVRAGTGPTMLELALEAHRNASLDAQADLPF